MPPFVIRPLLAAAALLLLAACQSMPFPPISEPPSNQHLPGKFVWHELVTPDVAAAKTFYGGLFGWTFRDIEGYTVIHNGEQRIGGIVPAGRASKADSARWVLSVSVKDVDESVVTAEELGGKRMSGPMDLQPRGRFALIADNRDAQLGLLHATAGDPPDRPPGIGDWLWHELWSNDLPAAERFYTDLFGYQSGSVELAIRNKVDYRVLRKDGKPRAGIGQIPWENVPDQWMPYVRVADVADTVARAERLGGKVYMKPADDEGNDAKALIADPNGAILMVEEWDGAAVANGEGGQ